MKKVVGKNVWITGASSGIGKALAMALAQRGNTVFASARNESELLNMAKQTRGKVVPLSCDVSCDESVAAAGQHLAEQVDSLDVMILNAGTCEYLDLPTFDVGKFERVFNVNFFGALRCLHIALPLLRKAQKRGLIVGTSSLSTVVGLPRAEAYGASKAALQYMLDSLRVDLKREKVDVLVVQPGFVATPMTVANDFPMPFIKTTDYAVERIIKAMDRRYKRLSFPWQLSSSLRVAACFKGLWYDVIAPKLARHNQL